MSDQIIHDSTPKGSALLAYGVSKNRSGLWIAIISAAILLAGIIFGIIVSLWQNSFPLPSNTYLLAYVRPGTDIPESAPVLWQDNLKKSPHSPIFLGLAQLDDGKVSPFTVSIRGIGSNNGITSGIWNLESDREDDRVEFVAIRSLVEGWSDYAARAWIQLWPGKIDAWSNAGFETDLRVGGTISDSVIKTNLQLPNQITQENGYRGDNFIRASAVPGSWLLIEPILRAQGLGVFLDTPPRAVAWANTDDKTTSFYFEFDGTLTSSTRSLIAGGYGLTNDRQYSLPDGTVLNELRLPMNAIAQSTSQTWDLPGGKALQFKSNTAILGDSNAFDEIHQLLGACKGTAIAAFDKKTTSNLVKQIGLMTETESEGIIFIEDGGYLSVCF